MLISDIKVPENTRICIKIVDGRQVISEDTENTIYQIESASWYPNKNLVILNVSGLTGVKIL